MRFPNPLAHLIRRGTTDHIPNYLTQEEPIYRWTVGQVIETGANPETRRTALGSYQPRSYQEALGHPFTIELDDMAARCSWDDEFMMTCHEFAIELYDVLSPLVQGKKTARQVLKDLNRKSKASGAVSTSSASALHQPGRQNDAHIMSFWIYELMEYGDDAAEEQSEMCQQVNRYLENMRDSPNPETSKLLSIIHRVAQEHDPQVANHCLAFSQYCWKQNALETRGQPATQHT